MDLAKIRKKARRDPHAPEAAPAPPQERDSAPASEFPPETRPQAQYAEAAPPPAPASPEEGVTPTLEPDAGVEVRREPSPEGRRPEAPPSPAEIPEPPELTPSPPETPERTPKVRERVLIFSVGREHYAMPIQDISLIIETRPATPVPSVPPFVVGIISLRGRIVTILDARKRLSLGEGTAPESAKVVVLDRGTDQFGILVDNIIHVLEVDRAAMEPPPEGFMHGEREFVNGVFYHKGTAVASLDLERFLDFQV